MPLYTVVSAPEAEDQLLDLFEYIAGASGNDFVAAQFVEAITRFCDGFERFPHRGDRRDDIETWRRECNEERPKKILGWLTPAAYAHQLAVRAVTMTPGL